MIPLILLGIGIAAYSISQLQQHNKFKWGGIGMTFWGEMSYMRKYKPYTFSNGGHGVTNAPKNNWYYRFFKIKYKERFPLSATFLVSLTDGYHMCQSVSFLSFAGAFSIALDINFFLMWFLILLIHFTVYRLLQK